MAESEEDAQLFGKKSILAFIGARASSKGLRNKNTRSFAGKPLICWTIEAALGSKFIDRTLVSTDGFRIARIAKAAGASVPFMRPAELATDTASLLHSIRHATHWLAEHEGNAYDYVMMLQPTSPLRNVRHINEAISYYFKHRKTNLDTLVSVTCAPAKTGWLLQRRQSGYIEFCFPTTAQKLERRSLPEYFFPNGAIFFGPLGVWSKRLFYSARTIPFLMPESASVDIDTAEDFKRALELYNLNE